MEWRSRARSSRRSLPTRIIGPSIADRLARGVAPHQATGSQQNLGSTVGASRVSSARRPPRYNTNTQCNDICTPSPF